MSSKDFQFLDNEPFDNSVVEKSFLKAYHRQRKQLNQSDQYIDFIYRDKNVYLQIGNVFF